jgi:hypothetical protein
MLETDTRVKGEVFIDGNGGLNLYAKIVGERWNWPGIRVVSIWYFLGGSYGVYRLAEYLCSYFAFKIVTNRDRLPYLLDARNPGAAAGDGQAESEHGNGQVTHDPQPP